MNLNVVNLVGHVGSAPEVKYFESGSIRCNLSLAVNRPTKDDKPDWFALKLWGKTAEFAANYVQKGRLIGVQGSLEIETWTDPQTNAPRSRPVIKVDRIELLGSKRDADPNAVNG
jgi:single-strand DNA-binding protein